MPPENCPLQQQGWGFRVITFEENVLGCRGPSWVLPNPELREAGERPGAPHPTVGGRPRPEFSEMKMGLRHSWPGAGGGGGTLILEDSRNNGQPKPFKGAAKRPSRSNTEPKQPKRRTRRHSKNAVTRAKCVWGHGFLPIP